ncbi:MAG: 2OG-Fe(II) oxygenase family protein [Alphaproteobacteria bacterium]
MASISLTPPAPTIPVAPALARGDRFPNLFLTAQDRKVASTTDRMKGGPALVYWFRDESDAEAVARLRRLAAAAPARLDQDAHVFAVTRAGADAVAALGAGIDPRLMLLSDPDGRGSAAMGLPLDRRFGIALLLDPNQRVLAVFDEADGDPVERGLAALDSHLPIPAPAFVPMCAPVLLVPRVLDPETCARLIDIYRTAGNEESGTFRMVDGKPVVSPNHAVKRRRDHHVTDPALYDELLGLLQRRVVPEIRRAFNFQVTRFEEFKIVRYDGEVGGYFKPHRDNTAPQTLHRRFAMTLNLNAEAYEGGNLRFPEFGNTLYRPGTGDAVLFSCSLLHEAQNVTRGERYVLLAFLFDEAGLKIKDEMRKRIAASQ